jgi:hypothetical protein
VAYKRWVLTNDDNVHRPLALQLKNGKVYAGCLEEYDSAQELIELFGCVLLDRENNRWVDHDFFVNRNGKIRLEGTPAFWLKEIKALFVLPEESSGLFLEDFLRIYLNPYYRPLVGFKCHLGSNGKHIPECDAKLHEALDVIADALTPLSNKEITEADDRKNWAAFHYIRDRLLLSGAKVP